MTLLPAFIARAADTRLRDALDQTRTKLRRTEDENIRLTRENIRLSGRLAELKESHDWAVAAWVKAARERDPFYVPYDANGQEIPDA